MDDPKNRPSEAHASAPLLMPAGIAGIIGLISICALSLIGYLLFREGGSQRANDFSWLPTMNAACNAVATCCLVLGYRAIRQARREVHRRWMISACATSTLFLLGYLLHHYLHGDTRYEAVGWLRTLYLTILASHVLLSIIVFPCVLIVLYWALTRNFVVHKKLARWVFPAWIYVSVTGVVVYLFQRL